ncbi:hypothetical protein V8017_12995 [Stenotrophomonas rhizophila]
MTTDNKSPRSAALNTSDGARRSIAEFFATELRRYDFNDYISIRLAADFACALAQHLATTSKQLVGEAKVHECAVFDQSSSAITTDSEETTRD